MSNYLFLLLLIACPLMMVFMMRGRHGGRDGDAKGGDGGHGHAGGCGHGHRNHGTGHDGDTDAGEDASLEELHRRREQLDREIEAHEVKGEVRTPVGGGRR